MGTQRSAAARGDTKRKTQENFLRAGVSPSHTRKKASPPSFAASGKNSPTRAVRISSSPSAKRKVSASSAKSVGRPSSSVKISAKEAGGLKRKLGPESKRDLKVVTGLSPAHTLENRVNPEIVREVAISTHLIMIAVAVLVMFGLLTVFSAGTSVDGYADTGYGVFLMQLLWVVIGCITAFVLSKLDYRIVAKLSLLFVICSVTVLVLVLPFGVQSSGSRRCLHIYGPINFQPSEFAKFSMILFSAYVLHAKRERIKKFSELFFPLLVLLALTCFLILYQPDLGSAVILFVCVLVVMTLSEARLSHTAIIGLSGTSFAVIAMCIEPYRLARLMAFLNPWKDALGYGYQLIQSYVAFGTGGILGLGPGMSRQKFLYLPNAHNDFVFSIIGEEFGLLGTFAIVAMFVLIAIAGMKIAEHARDELGRILAAGITSFFVIQALVNMGGVTGIMPLTGVTLPFVSAGGSSMIVCMACLGILFNVARQVEFTGGRV